MLVSVDWIWTVDWTMLPRGWRSQVPATRPWPLPDWPGPSKVSMAEGGMAPACGEHEGEVGCGIG